MKYRDHMNLGTLIYAPLLSWTCLGRVPQPLLYLVPFLRSVQNISWYPAVVTYLCFSVGCCLPDADMAWYPDGGHRMKSPAHNMSYMLIIYAAVLAAGLVPEIRKTGVFYSGLAAMVFGCLAHLLGDMIQGGVAWGLKKRKKRLGFSSFRWQVYSETYKGSFLSLGMAAAAFAFWGTLLYRLRFAVSPLSYGVIASACIWIYSIAACRSYHRYIGQAVTAMGLIALAYFYKPGIPGFF